MAVEVSARAIGALLVVVAVGCDTDPVTPPDPPAPTDAAAVDHPVTLPPPIADTAGPKPAVGPPGPAFFAVRGKGLVRLDATGLAVVAGSPTTGLGDLQRGRDGHVWLRADDALYRLSEDRLEAVVATPPSQTGRIHHFAVAADGTVWTTGTRGIGRHAAGRWTFEESEPITGSRQVVHDVAIDGENRPWLVTSTALVVREGDVYRRVTPAGRLPIYHALSALTGGSVLCAGTGSIWRLTDPSLAPAQMPLSIEHPVHFKAVSSSDNGHIVAKEGDRAVVAWEMGGNLKRFSIDARDFALGEVGEIAIDDRARLWITDDTGGVVLAPDGDPRAWRTGDVPLLDGAIVGILVVGAGPDAPRVTK